LFFDNACCLFCCNFFQLIIHLKYSFVENGFVNVGKQSLIPNHRLAEFNITHSVALQVFGHITYEDERHVFDAVFSISFRQQHFHNRFNRRQRETACFESVYQVVDASVYQEEGDLFVGVEGLTPLRFLKHSSHILHKFIIVKVNAYCRLQFVQIKLLKQNLSSILLRNICFLGNWKSFYCFNHEVSWEITANKTNHLMIIQPCNAMIIRSAMKHLSDLL